MKQPVKDPPHASGLKSLAGLSLHAEQAVRPLFDAGEALMVLIHTAKPKWIEGDKDPLVWGSIFRSMKTYRAVMILCDAGFGEQAGMLCRTLFEDMLVTHWIARTSPAELRVKFVDHADRVRLADQQALDKHGMAEMFLVEPLGDDRVAELEASGGAKGSFRTWHGMTVRALIAELKNDLDPTESRLLDRMHDVAYRLQNLLLHHSPSSFEFAIGMDVPASLIDPIAARSAGLPDAAQHGLATLSSRPHPRYVEQALTCAFYSVSRQARAVVDAKRRAELEALIQDAQKWVVPLPAGPPPQRNDVCPCGSGLKYKRCHGSR